MGGGERAGATVRPAVQEHRDRALLVEIDVARVIAPCPREPEGEEQAMDRVGIGRRELDERDAAQAAGILIGHGRPSGCQLFQ